MNVCDRAGALLEKGSRDGDREMEKGTEVGRWGVKGKKGEPAGQAPSCSPERLHFWGLLTALASKPVHILGGRPHHLVCLQLTLALCSVHL